MIWSVLHTRQTHLNRIQIEMVEGDKFKVIFTFNRRMYRQRRRARRLQTSSIVNIGTRLRVQKTSERPSSARVRNASTLKGDKSLPFHTSIVVTSHHIVIERTDVRALVWLGMCMCVGRELNGIKLIVQVENMKIVIYAIKQFYSNEARGTRQRCAALLRRVSNRWHSVRVCHLCWSCVDASSHRYARHR